MARVRVLAARRPQACRGRGGCRLNSALEVGVVLEPVPAPARVVVPFPMLACSTSPVMGHEAPRSPVEGHVVIGRPRGQSSFIPRASGSGAMSGSASMVTVPSFQIDQDRWSRGVGHGSSRVLCWYGSKRYSAQTGRGKGRNRGCTEREYFQPDEARESARRGRDGMQFAPGGRLTGRAGSAHHKAASPRVESDGLERAIDDNGSAPESAC